MKRASIAVLIIVGVVGLFLLLDFSSLMWEGFIGPRRENVRREIFEETKSYNEGKEQDLLNFRLEYMRAETDIEKEAIASTIRMMFADYDENQLSSELRSFLKEIKYGGDY